MVAKVELTVKGGGHRGETFVFREAARCVAGRASDCDVRLTGAFEDGLVSRHHCLLEIDPPFVRVRDLGSRNGTFVNGQVIGQRPRGLAPDQVPAEAAKAYDLRDGDELSVGPVVFQVTVAGAREPPSAS